MIENKRNMIRKESYPVDMILGLAQPFISSRKNAQGTKMEFDGDVIKMASDRYKCFVVSGKKCVTCEIEGTHFIKERDIHTKTYHFNLFGIDAEGNEVLMTKDHIMPKSKGGKDHIDNYQTMCETCNEAKGNKVLV